MKLMTPGDHGVGGEGVGGGAGHEWPILLGIRLTLRKRADLKGGFRGKSVMSTRLLGHAGGRCGSAGGWEGRREATKRRVKHMTMAPQSVCSGEHLRKQGTTTTTGTAAAAAAAYIPRAACECGREETGYKTATAPTPS